MEYKVSNMFKIKIDEEDLELVKLNYVEIAYDTYLQYYPKLKGLGRLSKVLTNAKRNEIVIHKNGDLMDCTKSNLFLTTEKALNEMVRNGEVTQYHTQNGAVHYDFGE